ncbi:MAG TPA: ATP-dependent DNA helicase, partial [Candidatus Dojkabacteria bacterium]
MKFSPTDQQRKAIEAGDGPVLIIAGAGTGKTFTITQRILYLIKNKNIDPASILALTFTEKAAYEMTERVEKELPLGFPELMISTFHSFCDEFLREEAINIGLSPDFEIMTQTDEVFFIRNNLFTFKLDYFRPKGNPSKFIAELSKHVSKLQDESVTPEEYRKYFESKSFENDEDSPEASKKKMEELVGFFEDYSKLKEKSDRLSFGDLIQKTFATLKSRPDLLKYWQKKYKYILIDEFQDTNYSQYELIKLIVESQKNPNIMVVADDDQSIYKFRGAAVSNVLEFSRDFPQAERIILTENRRSVQEILDRSYNVIQNNNPDRLEVKENIDKKLISKADRTKKFPKPVEFRSYKGAMDEAEGIAQEIKDLVKSNAVRADQIMMEIAESDIKYSDIAVLIRSHSLAEEISGALRRSGIPYQFSGARKLFNSPEVKELVNFLRILADYTDNVAMNGVLDYRIWRLSDREIIEVNILARLMKKSVFEVLEDKTILNAKFDRSKLAKLIELTNSLWKDMREGKTPWQILYTFVQESGYIADLSEEKNDNEGQVVRDVTEEFENEVKLRNIARLFDFINNFEKLNDSPTIYQLVDYIDLLLDSGDSPMLENTDIEEKNAVKILTVHASKGLEFPIVFIPSLIRNRFPARNRKDAIPIPEELIKELLPEGDEHIQEERRLFYVALTRAKYKAYLSAAHFYGEGKRGTKVSPFVVEAFEEEEIRDILDNPIDLDVTFSNIVEDEKTQEKRNPNKIKYISYSQISDYKTCPRKYKYKYVMRIPTKLSPALSYGISVHNTLNRFYEILRKSRSGLFDETHLLTQETLLKIYKDQWVSAGYLNQEHEEKAYKKGEEALGSFHKEFFEKTQNPIFLEQSFNLKFDEVTLRGKIDRVDVIKNDEGEERYEIIDYKTGDSERSQS